jgi:threonylcarbamoyladenosine tRNA methylthiotransferase MtaB
MPVQIPDPVKAARSDELLEMTMRQSQIYRRQFISAQEELLLEETAELPGGLYWRGHTKRYVEGHIPADGAGAAELREGQLVTGRFTGEMEEVPGLMFVPFNGIG